jgi:tetratricopeptide (TPR) repeat protein/transcriptional regulator with XRE-family HTH domain
MGAYELQQMSFGALVKYVRRKNGQKQLDVASAVPCSVGYLSEIERGRLPTRAIAEALVARLDPLEGETAALWAAYDRLVEQQAASDALRRSPVTNDAPQARWNGHALGPLVAREHELERLREALRWARRGMLHGVAILGEPGIGKTRLALETMAYAQAQGMRVVYGHCHAQLLNVALAPFIDLVEQLCAALPDALRKEIPTRWPMLRPLLPDAALSPAALAPLPAASDDILRLHKNMTGFLQAASAEQPLVVLLEDIHWADQTSLEMMQYIIRELSAHQAQQAHQTDGSPVLFVLTYRDTEVSRQPLLRSITHPLVKSHALERISLAPLTEAQTMKLLNAYLPHVAISSEAGARVHRSAGGVPYIAMETLQSMRERGDLALRDGAWQWVGTGDPEPREDILDETRERVERLRPLTQDVLRDASVLGEAFRAGVVMLMGEERTRGAVEDALAEAVRAGLVYDHGMAGYAFRHALARDAILKIHWDRRRELHRAAAEALAHAPGARARAAEVALHFREGDDIPQALSYTLKAGDEAEALYAHGEAHYHYDLAVSLARELGDHWREQEALALERLADVDYLLGRPNDAYNYLMRATTIYRASENWERLAWATCQMAKACDPLGRVPESMRFTEALLDKLIRVAGETHARRDALRADTLETLEDRAERAVTILTARTATRVFLCLVARLVQLGRFAEVAPLSRAAVDHARRANDPRMESLTHAFRGIAQAQLGKMNDALAAFHEALRTAELCGDYEATFMALANLGAIHEQRGETVAARDDLLRAVEALRQLGDTARTSEMLYTLGMNAFTLGDWVDARRRYEDALALIAASDQSQIHPARLGLVYLDLAEGKRALAETLSSGDVTMTYQHHDINFRLYATTTFAELEILAGFSGAVRDRLRAAMDDADIRDPQRCESFALLAWAECDLGHAEAAHDALAKAHQLAERLDAQLAYVTIWRVEAIIALTDRRWDDAAQALESLLALTRAMPAPYAEAKALYRAGQFSRERGDLAQAREHFEQALAILNRLGERLYAEWVARELAALA